MFFSILTIRNQIAFRQLTYIGKIVRGKSTHIAARLLTAWCDHPCTVGRPILTNKPCIVRNIQLVITEVDDDGTLASCLFNAPDASFWNNLLRTLKHPENDPPESPTTHIFYPDQFFTKLKWKSPPATCLSSIVNNSTKKPRTISPSPFTVTTFTSNTTLSHTPEKPSAFSTPRNKEL